MRLAVLGKDTDELEGYWVPGHLLSARGATAN